MVAMVAVRLLIRSAQAFLARWAKQRVFRDVAWLARDAGFALPLVLACVSF